MQLELNRMEWLVLFYNTDSPTRTTIHGINNLIRQERSTRTQCGEIKDRSHIELTDPKEYQSVQIICRSCKLLISLSAQVTGHPETHIQTDKEKHQV